MIIDNLIVKLKLFLLVFLALTGLTAAEDDFYSLNEDKDVWVYYSVNESFEGRSNSINMILENESSVVEDLLSSNWREAEGTERYAYMEIDNEGEWLEEYTQLEKGKYYSTRKHLRLYDVGSYSLIQGHKDFWNWFTLRHEVTSNEKALVELEKDFLESESSVERVYIGNEGILDSTGWVPVVTLAFSLLILRKRFRSLKKSFKNHISQIKIFAIVSFVFMIVKTLPILLEPSTNIDNYLITFSFYIFLVIGLPSAIFFLRSKEPVYDFYSILASLGLVMFVDTLFFQTSYVPGSYFIQFFGFSLLLSLLPFTLKRAPKKRLKTTLWIIVYLSWLSLILIGLI